MILVESVDSVIQGLIVEVGGYSFWVMWLISGWFGFFSSDLQV